VTTRKIRSFVCPHCSYEIATIYQTDDGQRLDSHMGLKLIIVDPSSRLGMLECPNCSKVSLVNWQELQPERKPVRGVEVKSSRSVNK
jgi:predicted RNA-binding Zn-ribbon protein involved in translation (DUF1610 family)